MRMQFFVETEPGGEAWAVRASDHRGTVTVRTFASVDEAVELAAGCNARLLELEPPARRTETIGEAMKRLQAETGATPIVDARGRRYGVHHRNQHTD